METYWVPGVSNLRYHGGWACAEIAEAYRIEAESHPHDRRLGRERGTPR